MKYVDAVYGEVTISHPFVIDLLRSRLFSRLKKLSIKGACYYNAHVKKRPHISVFDHCVGVFLLLKQLGSPIEQQITALTIAHEPFFYQMRCFPYLYKNEKSVYYFSWYDGVIETLLAKHHVVIDPQVRTWTSECHPFFLDLALREGQVRNVDLSGVTLENGVCRFSKDTQTFIDSVMMDLHTRMWNSPFYVLLTHFFEEAFSYAKKQRILSERYLKKPIDESMARFMRYQQGTHKRHVKRFRTLTPSDIILVDQEKADLTLSTRVIPFLSSQEGMHYSYQFL